MSERSSTIPDRLERAAGQPPEPPAETPAGELRIPDAWRSPEDGAEQLYALWREYNRRKVGVYRKAIERYHSERAGIKPVPTPANADDAPAPANIDVGEGFTPSRGRGSTPPLQRIPASDRAELMAAVERDSALTSVKSQIAKRFHDPAIRVAFDTNLRRILAEEADRPPTMEAYEETASERATIWDALLDRYRTLFRIREHEPEETDLLDLSDFSARLDAYDTRIRALERDPAIAARASSDRLHRYAEEMRAHGFAFTDSRITYIRQLLNLAVLLNRNRPLVLVGETGTGKTELVRALARLLTNTEPFRTAARDQQDPGRVLGARAMAGEQTTTAYGTIGQGLIGKKTALETEPGPGGVILMDEANKYPEDFLRMLVKMLAGRKPGDELTFDEWYGILEPLAPQSLLVLAMNLPDVERGRHLDRPDFSPEVKRELAPTTILIEYLPQSVKDPELFEVLLSACEDKNERTRIPPSELAPHYFEAVDTATNTKREELDRAPDAGGTLWRFASCIAESQRLYTGKPIISGEAILAVHGKKLEHAMLEVGLAVAWLREYQKSELRKGTTLQCFLADKLESWAGSTTSGGQQLFPKEDREVLAKLFTAFRLDQASATDEKEYAHGVAAAGRRDPTPTPAILSSLEVGSISPRVPREVQKLTEVGDPTESTTILPDGTIVKYRKETLGDVRPGVRFHTKSDLVEAVASDLYGPPTVWTFRGVAIGTEAAPGHPAIPSGSAILESASGVIALPTPEELTQGYERAPETGRLTATVRADALCTIPAERGKEVTFDLRDVLESSARFLEAKAPSTWAQSLREQFPHGITLTPEQRQTIETAMAHGFTRAILMPGVDVQGKSVAERTATTDHLLNTCSNADGAHPVPGLPDTEQYTAPYVLEPEKTKASTLRPNAPSRQRPYLVLVGPGSIPENLKNLTYPDAEAAFTQRATDLHLPTLTGLTTPERLLLQRRECEERAPLTPAQRTATYGDSRPHAFDTYSDTATESNWTWDLDSRVPGGVCHGDWDPRRRQLELVWCDASGRDSELGARPAVVVEL
ncbi:MAG: AAA family ATPase [Candidatus Uhrbacteria bacterium]